MSSASDGSALGHGASNLTQEAVTRAKAGDSEGLHYLYVRYADDVLRFVNGLIAFISLPKTSPRTSSPS